MAEDLESMCDVRKKAMSLTAKENLLRVIHHREPEWVPNGMESVVRIHPPVIERPSEAGCDAFGVHWSYKEGAEGGTCQADVACAAAGSVAGGQIEHVAGADLLLL